jgi:uncharacterized protein YbgA (DUF1722 family)/uncharacterized protein YbbK (DUF523 family)
MHDSAPLRLGISSCLLGEEVRFDGGHKRDAFLVQTLGKFVEWVPVCPEVEIGLSVPRPSLRLVGEPEEPSLVVQKTGEDLTGLMQTWGEARIAALAASNIDGYVLKKDSPSCGMERVRVYGPGSAPSRRGSGIFAAQLMERMPLLPVEEEGRLNDPVLRENFIERLFAYRAWREFVANDPGPGDLVALHGSYKLTLMAHHPQRYRELGRLVAGAGKRKMPQLLAEYGEGFMAALRYRATRRKHANVLYHLAGFLKRALDGADREELVALIESYRTGLVPLVVPVTLLRHHFRRHPHEWVSQQSYLNPYPSELMLRNHV